MAAQHRCCLIRDACVIEGELVIYAPFDTMSQHSATGGMFHISSWGSWTPRVISQRFPRHLIPDADPSAFVVLGHALGDVHSTHDVQFASDSIIPAAVALSYFNMTGHPFRLLLLHPPNFHNPDAPAPAPSLAGTRAAASSPWLTPLTPLTPLIPHDLPSTACFAHIIVGHESAFRLTPHSDAVRGVALRQLRDRVLRHYVAQTAAASALQINLYVHSSSGSTNPPRIDCARFSQLLEGYASETDKHCVDLDATGSFAAAVGAISRAHLHVVPGDLPHAPMLLLARDAAVVFVVHSTGSNPELVAAPLQLLGDLPWLHVSHVWDSDELLHSKLLEAVVDATIKAQMSSAHG
jgi:hypothetical protein